MFFFKGQTRFRNIEQFFFFFFFIKNLRTTNGENVLEDIKGKDGNLDFYSLDYNSKKANKLKYNREKKIYIKNMNFLGEKGNIRNIDNVQSEDVVVAHSSNDISFENLKGSNIGKNLSNHVYIKKDSLYNSNENNNIKGEINNEKNYIAKSFIHNEEEAYNIRKSLYDKMDQHAVFNPFIDMEIDFIDLQYFKDILDLIPGNTSYSKYYNEEFKKIIDEYSDILSNLVKTCITEKMELIKLEHEIKYPKKDSMEKKLEEKSIELESKRELYHNKLNNYYKNIKPKMDEVRNKGHALLQESYCTENCSTYIAKYDDLVEKILLDIKNYGNKGHVVLEKSINDFSFLDMILQYSNQQNNDMRESINTLQLLGEEIKEISEIYLINSTLINDLTNFFLEIKKIKEPIDSKQFTEKLKTLIRNSCLFRHIHKFNEPITQIYETKVTSSNKLFTSVIEKLQNETESLIKTLLDDLEFHEIRKNSEEITNYVKNMYDKNKELYDSMIKGLDENINLKIDKLDEFLSYQYYINDDIVNYNDFISLKYKHIYIHLKAECEKDLRERKLLPNNVLKAKLFLEIIIKIKADEKIISESFDTAKKFYEKIKDLKKEFEEAYVEFEEVKNEINKMKNIDDNRDKNIEEIKDKLEHITKKQNNLKEVAALKDKGNVEITASDELLAIIPNKNENEFKNKIDKTRDDMNSLFKSLNNDNINRLIESTEEFVNQKKNISFEDMASEVIENHLQDIRNKFDKINFISDDKMKELHDKMKEQVTIAENIKKEIVKKEIENLQKELAKFFSTFNSEQQELLISLEEYKREGEKIQKYRDSLLKRENEYFSSVHVDTNDLEKTKNQAELDKLQDTFAKKKDEISRKINNIKDLINTANPHLNFYSFVEKYFNINEDKKGVENIKALKDKINNVDMNKQVLELENDFKRKTDALENDIISIKSITKKLISLSTLNKNINQCDENNGAAELLKNNAKRLREEVEKEIGVTQDDKVIGKDIIKTLVENLNVKLSNLDNKLKQNEIDDLVEKLTDLKNLYSKSKISVHEEKEEYHLQDVFTETNKLEEIKTKFNELNVYYEILNKNKITLFKNNSTIYIESIYSLIRNAIDKIKHEEKEILKSVKNIEEKLNVIEVNEAYKNVINLENEKKIQVVRTSIREIKKLVDRYEGEMIKLENNSSNLKKRAQEKENDIEHLNKIKNDMKIIYEELNKIFGDIKSGTENELKVAYKDTNNIEILYERNLIEYILGKIGIEKNKSQKSMEEINSLKEKIEDIISNTHGAEKDEVTLSKCKEHFENAKKYEVVIKDIEQESTKLKSKSQNVVIFEEISKIKGNVNINLQRSVQENGNINNVLLELKGINNLLISSSFDSTMEYIKVNMEEANKKSNLTKEVYDKTVDEEKRVKEKFEKAHKLKEEISKDLDDSKIDNKVKEIEKIKNEISKIKEDAHIFLEDSKKYNKICLTHFENTKNGKNYIEYLKNKDNGEKQGRSNIDIREVDDKVSKAQQASLEAVHYEKETEKSYKSISKFTDDINNLFNDSLIKEVKTKCEKLNDEIQQVIEQIKNVGSTIGEELDKNKEKITELKKQFNIEIKEGEQLNEISMESFLEIQNYRKELDNLLLNLENIKINKDNFINTANKPMESILSIPELNKKNSLQDLKNDKTNYEKNLEKIKTEKNLIDGEEKKLNEISKKIIFIENELNKYKKDYENGLLKKIKENAHVRKQNFELTRDEINSLIDPSTSVFVKFKLEGYDITNNLNNYRTKINRFHTDFNDSFNTIISYESKVNDNSVTCNDAQKLRAQAQIEEEKLRNKEEEAKTLLYDIKKEESLRLLNDMKKKLNAEKEYITNDHSRINIHKENIEKSVNSLKELNDINKSLSILNYSINNVNETKETRHAYHNREAKKIYENMIEVANHFLNDENKIKLDLDINLERPTLKTNIESDIFKIIKEAIVILKCIEGYLDNIMKKQIASEKLITQANDIYYAIKLRNNCNKKIDETKSKEVIVSRSIKDALYKLKKIEELKCQHENYGDILEGRDEYENLKNITIIYQDKKGKMEKESLFKEMENKLQNFRSSLNNLEELVKPSKENANDITKMKKCNVDIDAVSKELNTIDSRLLEINSTFEELLQLGKSCQTHWISLISSTLNNKISKYLMIIRKQKENTENFMIFVKKNFSSTSDFVSELKKFYDRNLSINNGTSIVESADENSKKFKQQEVEVRGTIKDIKSILYAFDPSADISIADKGIHNMVKLYNKMKREKTEIDNIYENMSIIKLKEIENSCDAFNPVLELHRNMTKTKEKDFLEREKQLKNIYNNIKEKELHFNKTCHKYSPGSIKEANEIYNNIESEMKKLEAFENNNNDNYIINVEKYKEHITRLMDRADILLNEVDIFKRENNSNIMDVNKDMAHKMSTNVEEITRKLNNSKSEYGKILNNIIQNESILLNINLMKKNIREIFEEIKKKKESQLSELKEQWKLNQIKEMLDDINSIVTENVKHHKIDEKIKKLTKNHEERKGIPKNYSSVDDIDNVLNDIISDNEEIEDIFKVLNGVLQQIKKKKEEMDSVFNKISEDDNSSEYKSGKIYIEDGVKVLGYVNNLISNMDNLIKDNKKIIQELNDQKSNIEREMAANSLLVHKVINRREKEKEKTEPKESIHVKVGTTVNALKNGEEHPGKHKEGEIRSHNNLMHGNTIREQVETMGKKHKESQKDVGYHKIDGASTSSDSEHTNKEKQQEKIIVAHGRVDVPESAELRSNNNNIEANTLEEQKLIKEKVATKDIRDDINIDNHTKNETQTLSVSNVSETHETKDNNKDHSSSSDEKNQSMPKSLFERINYAKGIIIGLSIFAAMGMYIVNIKYAEENEDNAFDEHIVFNATNSSYNQNKEEIIDVSFCWI
ncbi:reticulocyte binding protein 1 [Plasmodium malariae]|uniref:Reticulocyte binding protein 1 n=1 Tax=Plasmodium malariae TaxID=5858 RepID=A0A1A8WKI1_PLAMA|nr:reticulocyte binding protein 1 [Plasmodium malariae]